jgi:lipoic acid synthetase
MRKRKPQWLKRKIPAPGHMQQIRDILDELGLNTVCQSALCPNAGECFSRGTATFMILGQVCSRDCKFCAVKSGDCEDVDENEPARIADAVRRLGLKHAVITSVTRDDLSDGGSAHFARVIECVRDLNPTTTIEVLTPDFLGDTACIKRVTDAKPDIYNHNIETVPRLYDRVRPEASYERSLKVLKIVKELDPDIHTKSGIMVGLGETRDEVKQVMKNLVSAKCEILTIGQYLQPSLRHLEVQEYVSPRTFADYKKMGYSVGFKLVVSGPYVRSSYHADLAMQELEQSRYGSL